MKLIYSITIFIIFFLCKFSFAQSIAVLNLQSLIDNNDQYINLLKEIEISQQKYLKKFELTETKLDNKLEEIENSKLILNDDEINIRINDYNQTLNDFKILVEEFNTHYQNQIIIIREVILSEIILLLEEYAIKNNTTLILDSKSYLIASNSIDITNKISNELAKINFKLEYKDFEKY